MKSIALAVSMFVALTSQAMSYTIGDAYAHLISCDWGQWGYEYGYIGTYKVNQQVYRVFFGSTYCEF